MNKQIDKLEQRLFVWKKHYHTDKMIRIAEEIPLRQDMVTLLAFVNENKVVGTQSTGNMPLKMVREVSAKFVNPPVLDKTIGDRIYRIRSEENVWPLRFLHILAEVGALLQIAPARRWKLTAGGKKFLSIDALLQTLFLLTVWWYEVNWLVAYPFAGMGDNLPRFFNYSTLEALLSLRRGTNIRIDEFAANLIEKTGLVWHAPKSDFADKLLQSSIEQMIIGILKEFGAVECKYRDEPLGKGTISRLETFKIVPFGRALFESLAIMA